MMYKDSPSKGEEDGQSSPDPLSRKRSAEAELDQARQKKLQSMLFFQQQQLLPQHQQQPYAPSQFFQSGSVPFPSTIPSFSTTPPTQQGSMPAPPPPSSSSSLLGLKTESSQERLNPGSMYFTPSSHNNQPNASLGLFAPPLSQYPMMFTSHGRPSSPTQSSSASSSQQSLFPSLQAFQQFQNHLAIQQTQFQLQMQQQLQYQQQQQQMQQLQQLQQLQRTNTGDENRSTFPGQLVLLGNTGANGMNGVFMTQQGFGGVKPGTQGGDGEADQKNEELKKRYLKDLLESARQRGNELALSIGTQKLISNGLFELPGVNLSLASRRVRQKQQQASAYTGVSWQKGESPWVATVVFQSKSTAIGKFKTEKEAAKEVDKYILKLRELGVDDSSMPLNFPDEKADPDAPTPLLDQVLGEQLSNKNGVQSSQTDRIDGMSRSTSVASTSSSSSSAASSSVSDVAKAPRSFKYRGVCWNKCNQSWKASIKIHGKNTHIGYFDNVHEAALAYDLKALEVRGDRATLNFPDGFPPKLLLSPDESLTSLA